MTRKQIKQLIPIALEVLLFALQDGLTKKEYITVNTTPEIEDITASIDDEYHASQ